jgi:hypothetical protein
MPTGSDTAYPRLKANPTERELEAIYTSTTEEIQLARQSTKGEVAHVGFLVLLKTFQRLGYPDLSFRGACSDRSAHSCYQPDRNYQSRLGRLRCLSHSQTSPNRYSKFFEFTSLQIRCSYQIVSKSVTFKSDIPEI